MGSYFALGSSAFFALKLADCLECFLCVVLLSIVTYICTCKYLGNSSERVREYSTIEMPYFINSVFSQVSLVLPFFVKGPCLSLCIYMNMLNVVYMYISVSLLMCIHVYKCTVDVYRLHDSKFVGSLVPVQCPCGVRQNASGNTSTTTDKSHTRWCST